MNYLLVLNTIKTNKITLVKKLQFYLNSKKVIEN